ncbi:hypothetical protein [Frankia sp. AgB32]|uniref:hypothetical protein n=1 Tax=Frankia sp. AgB32 TaxID=631119 RepID=UPI00200F01CE|nr:hypothetical protein [Frankia sp. AgB32]MCK9896062.1 hypothetical protein [Frankia sp. AgB32]
MRFRKIGLIVMTTAAAAGITLAGPTSAQAATGTPAIGSSSAAFAQPNGQDLTGDAGSYGFANHGPGRGPVYRPAPQPRRPHNPPRRNNGPGNGRPGDHRGGDHRGGDHRGGDHRGGQHW